MNIGDRPQRTGPPFGDQAWNSVCADDADHGHAGVLRSPGPGWRRPEPRIRFFTALGPRTRPYNRRMLAERPLPEDLADRIEALSQAWSGDPELAAIYLFGSRGSRREGPQSDVDLAVVLREEIDADAGWRKRLALLSDACRRLGTDTVDPIILEDAPAPLGHRVLKGDRLLRDVLPERRAAVAERILKRYLDEAYLRRVLDAGLAARLREKRFGR